MTKTNEINRYEPVRYPSGNIKKVMVQVPIGDIKFEYFDQQGNPVDKPAEDHPGNQVIVRAPGISPMTVRRVDIDPIDYSNDGTRYAFVTCYVFEGFQYPENAEELPDEIGNDVAC